MAFSFTPEHLCNAAGSLTLLGSGIFLIQSEKKDETNSFLSDKNIYLSAMIVPALISIIVLVIILFEDVNYLEKILSFLFLLFINAIGCIYIYFLWIWFEGTRKKRSEEIAAESELRPDDTLSPDNKKIKDYLVKQETLIKEAENQRRFRKKISGISLVVGSLFIFLGALFALIGEPSSHVDYKSPSLPKCIH